MAFDEISSLLYCFPIRAHHGRRKIIRIISIRDARDSAGAKLLEDGD